MNINIKELEWEEINGSTLRGSVNGITLFNIRVEGVEVFKVSLITYPFDNVLFATGLTSKIQKILKTENPEAVNDLVTVLKFEARDLYEEFVSMFSIKPKLYRVKVEKENQESFTQYINGYLAFNNQIMTYTRGQALRKAKLFNGKIEEV